MQKIRKLYLMVMDKGKVLIVDDEPDIREGFRHILDWDGMGLTIIGTASSGEEALPIIRSLHPDIVLSDIVMNGMSGLDLIEKAASEGIEAQFILISGYNEFKYAQKAIALGASNYILKPVDKDELEKAVLKAKSRIAASNTATIDIEILKRNARLLFLQHMVNGDLRSDAEIEEGLESFSAALEDSEAAVIAIASRSGRHVCDSPSAALYMGKERIEAIDDKTRTIIIMNGSERVVIHFARQLIELLSKDGLKDFVAGVGSTQPHLISISQSYMEAIAALSYQAYGGDKKIFTQCDISKDRPALSTSNIDIGKLKEAIKASDAEAITSYMDDFFNSMLFAETPPPSYVKGMLLFLMNGVERGLAEDEDIKQEAFDRIRPSIAEPMLMLEEIKERISEYFIAISQSIIPEARLSSDRIIKECRKYVDENIKGKISEDELASMLGISQPYLSAYFSRTTGETFRSYVNRIRNEEAKNMLGSGKRIDEVSESLGYSDYRSFHRIFKRMNGVSPSQWKKHSAK